MAPAFQRYLDILFVLFVVSLATSISGMELFSLLLIVSTLIGGVVLRKRWQFPAFSLPIGIFVLVMVAGIVLGKASSAEKMADLGRLRYFALFFGLSLYLQWFRPTTRLFLLSLAAICTVVGIYGAFQHFFPLDLTRPEGKKIILYAIPTERLGPLTLGTFNHHLTFSNVYLLFACLFLSIGLYAQKAKWALGLGILLAVDCVWSGSRMVWLALPVVLLLLSWKRGKRLAAGVAVVVGIIGTVFFMTDEGLRERLTRTRWSGSDNYAFTERTRLWQLQWEMFKESALVGVGWNNNERFCKEYFHAHFPEEKNVFCGHAHSTIMQLLSTTGILGLLAYFGVWVAVFRRLWVRQKNVLRGGLEAALNYGIFCAFVGFHLQGLTQWNFGDGEVLHSIVFLWAWIATGD